MLKWKALNVRKHFKLDWYKIINNKPLVKLSQTMQKTEKLCNFKNVLSVRAFSP